MGQIPRPLSRDAALDDIRRRVDDLESSPDLYGATITGGILRTAADGPRIEIRPDLWPSGWQGIRMYDRSGNTGVPEIKALLENGDLYLTSGEQVSGSSGNAELRLRTGGNWRLGSTHFANDASIGTNGADIAVQSNLGQVSVIGNKVQLSSPTSAIGLGDGDVCLSAAGAATVRAVGGDVNINTSAAGASAWLASDAGPVNIRAHGGDVNINTDAAGAIAWLTSNNGDVRIACAPTGGIYLQQSGPTVSGKTPNVYMDPTTGRLQRIA